MKAKGGSFASSAASAAAVQANTTAPIALARIREAVIIPSE
jgi:hypothetical protein